MQHSKSSRQCTSCFCSYHSRVDCTEAWKQHSQSQRLWPKSSSLCMQHFVALHVSHVCMHVSFARLQKSLSNNPVSELCCRLRVRAFPTALKPAARPGTRTAAPGRPERAVTKSTAVVIDVSKDEPDSSAMPSSAAALPGSQPVQKPSAPKRKVHTSSGHLAWESSVAQQATEAGADSSGQGVAKAGNSGNLQQTRMLQNQHAKPPVAKHTRAAKQRAQCDCSNCMNPHMTEGCIFLAAARAALAQIKPLMPA